MSHPLLEPRDPELDRDGFTCPRCGAFAHQEWDAAYLQRDGNADLIQAVEIVGARRIEWGLKVARCRRCKVFSVWVTRTHTGASGTIYKEGHLVWPRRTTAPFANEGMPGSVREFYDEARSVLADSPRSSAAMLRLAIQQLCIELGLPGKNLNSDIGELVKRGLDARAQKALDAVRVIGNGSVHPGQIDLKDDLDTANKLFRLVNIIVQEVITDKEMVDRLYDEKVPESKKEQTQKRDRDATGEEPQEL